MKGKKDDMRQVNDTNRLLDLADDEEGWLDGVADDDGIGRGGGGGKRTRRALWPTQQMQFTKECLPKL